MKCAKVAAFNASILAIVVISGCSQQDSDTSHVTHRSGTDFVLRTYSKKLYTRGTLDKSEITEILAGSELIPTDPYSGKLERFYKDGVYSVRLTEIFDTLTGSYRVQSHGYCIILPYKQCFILMAADKDIIIRVPVQPDQKKLKVSIKLERIHS